MTTPRCPLCYRTGEGEQRATEAARERLALAIEGMARDRDARANAMIPPNPMFGLEKWAAEALREAARVARVTL